jgi:hypothetical protein
MTYEVSFTQSGKKQVVLVRAASLDDAKFVLGLKVRDHDEYVKTASVKLYVEESFNLSPFLPYPKGGMR